MFARKILAAALLVAVALPVGAQDDQAAMMEAWTKAATPGPMHAFFAGRTGDWELTAYQYMQPGAEPLQSTSTARAEMMLGGRYLVEHVQGTSMGLPFEGMGSTGYDNTTGVVTSTWIDNFGTGTMIMTGKYEQAGDPLVVTGTMVDPASGAEITLSSITEFVGDDAHTVTMYMSMPGLPEMKSMVLEYVRK
jgi:hypothetical protein